MAESCGLFFAALGSWAKHCVWQKVPWNTMGIIYTVIPYSPHLHVLYEKSYHMYIYIYICMYLYLHIIYICHKAWGFHRYHGNAIPKSKPCYRLFEERKPPWLGNPLGPCLWSYMFAVYYPHRTLYLLHLLIITLMHMNTYDTFACTYSKNISYIILYII
jgi:hypothetical protein